MRKSSNSQTSFVSSGPLRKSRLRSPTLCLAVLAVIAAPSAAQETELVTAVSDQYPSISPDGTKVVFESNRGGSIDQIFVLDLVTNEVEQLTDSPEQNETPKWSPDGSKILFARRMAEEPRSAWEVFDMDPDGSNQRQLTYSQGHDGHARYNADGSLIVFNSARSTDFSGLSEEHLDTGGYNYEIYVMRSDGSDVRRLTDFHEWDTYPSISPDGRHLLWRRVLPDGGSGRSGRNSEIFLADVDGSNVRNLSQDPSFDGYPVWSPDGRFIAFASNRDGESLLEFNLYLMHFESGEIIRLTETIPNVEQVRPSWSPDGRSIIFNRDFPDGRAEIHILNVPTTAEASAGRE